MTQEEREKDFHAWFMRAWDNSGKQFLNFAERDMLMDLYYKGYTAKEAATEIMKDVNEIKQ